MAKPGISCRNSFQVSIGQTASVQSRRAMAVVVCRRPCVPPAGPKGSPGWAILRMTAPRCLPPLDSATCPDRSRKISPAGAPSENAHSPLARCRNDAADAMTRRSVSASAEKIGNLLRLWGANVMAALRKAFGTRGAAGQQGQIWRAFLVLERHPCPQLADPS